MLQVTYSMGQVRCQGEPVYATQLCFAVQKEILMGPKGSATKVIQQVRNDHTNVFLKLHDDSTTADQKRKLEFRGPSRHHIEAVKYDIDQQMKHGGQSPLPALKWDTGSESQ